MPALRLISDSNLAVDFHLPPAARVEHFLRGLDTPMSQDEIAQRTRVTRRGLQKIIVRLRAERGLCVSPKSRGCPSRYKFAPVRPNECAAVRPKFAELFDYHKVQGVDSPEPTSSSAPARPAPRNSQFHTTHRTSHMGHGFNTHGRSSKKGKHGKKWKLTRELLCDDAALRAVAADYAAMGWIPDGEAGLTIVFEAAEHALSAKADTVCGLFVSRVKDWRQGEFHPIGSCTEERARRRLKRALYGEQPSRRDRDPLEEIL